MMTDPIADMLTRIRNASFVHKHEVVVPFSKLKLALAHILVQEGYLANVTTEDQPQPSLVISLKYGDGRPAISHIKRVSTPGSRRYLKKDELQAVLGGYGIQVVSTSQGLMTGKQAQQKKLGGEVLCEVY